MRQNKSQGPKSPGKPSKIWGHKWTYSTAIIHEMELYVDSLGFKVEVEEVGVVEEEEEEEVKEEEVMG
ncbi:hypothetical protein M0802_009979 [Mischocyttarus mexicanus]|nr:hypothetical protein M0802_009979 [Mischocyttarus mexicanus]